MITSMTGYGFRAKNIAPFGKVSVELRCANHKFLDIVFHLPDGFLALEDKIKKELESGIKRGRVVCAVSVNGQKSSEACVNTALLKKYVMMLRKVKKEFRISDDISINTLVHLPGVLSFEEHKAPGENLWPGLKILFGQALSDLNKTRQKEGRALYTHLKKRAEALKKSLAAVRQRYRAALNKKAGTLKTDEEKTSFLKSADINEEVERLAFHFSNFISKISKDGPVGKELDFIAQEMQREANTMAAKTFDSLTSARVVQIKSQIEKIREQVQNIE